MATVNRLFSAPNEVWFDNFSFSINFNKYNIDQFVSSFDTYTPTPRVNEQCVPVQQSAIENLKIFTSFRQILEFLVLPRQWCLVISSTVVPSKFVASSQMPGRHEQDTLLRVLREMKLCHRGRSIMISVHYGGFHKLGKLSQFKAFFQIGDGNKTLVFDHQNSTLGGQLPKGVFDKFGWVLSLNS